MTQAKRQAVLIGGAVLAVLWWVLISPAIDRWNAQTDRITALKKQVHDGDMLLGRATYLRDRWTGMKQENLPADDSAAETTVYKAIARWERDARVLTTSINKDKQWKVAEDGSQTLEFHISVNGDQASIGRFLYEMQNDTVPVNLTVCDITPHDTRGQQLTLGATFSFLRMPVENTP